MGLENSITYKYIDHIGVYSIGTVWPRLTHITQNNIQIKSHLIVTTLLVHQYNYYYYLSLLNTARAHTLYSE